MLVLLLLVVVVLLLLLLLVLLLMLLLMVLLVLLMLLVLVLFSQTCMVRAATKSTPTYWCMSIYCFHLWCARTHAPVWLT